jgi:hypothetical protein
MLDAFFTFTKISTSNNKLPQAHSAMPSVLVATQLGTAASPTVACATVREMGSERIGMNLDQVNTFLSLVYPSHAARIALCLIPPDGEQPEHRFTAVDRLSRFLSYAGYRNAHGWGVYVTPSVLKSMACTRRKESFQDRQGVIYLDCDQALCLDRIKERYPYPTLVVRTSQGRYQIYWRLRQPVRIAEQEQLMSALAVHINADRAATDVSRVLRLPGFWNRKPNRNNTVDIVFIRDHAVSYTSLLEKLPLSRLPDFAPNTVTTEPTHAPRVLGKRTRGKSTTGLSQSERDWYEVHRRLGQGYQADELVNWLERKRRDKRNPRYYAEQTVRKALMARKGNQHGTAQ